MSSSISQHFIMPPMSGRVLHHSLSCHILHLVQSFSRCASQHSVYLTYVVYNLTYYTDNTPMCHCKASQELLTNKIELMIHGIAHESSMTYSLLNFPFSLSCPSSLHIYPPYILIWLYAQSLYLNTCCLEWQPSAPTLPV